MDCELYVDMVKNELITTNCVVLYNAWLKANSMIVFLRNGVYLRAQGAFLACSLFLCWGHPQLCWNDAVSVDGRIVVEGRRPYIIITAFVSCRHFVLLLCHIHWYFSTLHGRAGAAYANTTASTDHCDLNQNWTLIVTCMANNDE